MAPQVAPRSNSKCRRSPRCEATSENSVMRPNFVLGGEANLRRSAEFQARVREVRASILARHAADFAHAGFFGRLILHWRVAVEFRRACRKLEPSPEALYSLQTVVQCPKGFGAVNPCVSAMRSDEPTTAACPKPMIGSNRRCVNVAIVGHHAIGAATPVDE